MLSDPRFPVGTRVWCYLAGYKLFGQVTAIDTSTAPPRYTIRTATGRTEPNLPEHILTKAQTGGLQAL